jgi:hypothetical protein
MTTLTGKTIASTYKDLLQVSNSNSGIDGTLRPVSDGEGTGSPLNLSTTSAKFDLTDNTASAFTIVEGANNYIKIDTTNSSELITLVKNVVLSGDLTVNGTTTTINTATLNVEDKNITTNVGGTTALSTGAGLNIEGDAAAVVGYFRVNSSDNANLEFKAPGNAGVLTLDINATETLTITGSLNVEATSIINQDVTSDATVDFKTATLTQAAAGARSTMLIADNTDTTVGARGAIKIGSGVSAGGANDRSLVIESGREFASTDVYTALVVSGNSIASNWIVNKYTSAGAITTQITGNVGLGTSDFASGVASVLAMANSTAPSGTPTGGGVLYVESGALKYKGTSGTITTLGVA